MSKKVLILILGISVLRATIDYEDYHLLDEGELVKEMDIR